MNTITTKKKAGSYIGLTIILGFMGVFLIVVGAVNGGFDMAAIGAVGLGMAIYMYLKSSKFEVVLDESGVTYRRLSKPEEHKDWDQLELWLTLTPKGQLRDIILRSDSKNWCEMDEIKSLENGKEALDMLIKRLGVSKMFDNRGEVAVPEEWK